MLATRRTTRRSEGRLRRVADEVYVGALVAAVVIIVGVSLVATVLYIMDFTRWVALND